jgi:hypothetical protein
MRLSWTSFSAAVFLACLCACSSPYPDRRGSGGESEEQGDAEVESLFVPSIDAPGLFEFETRDSTYIADRGFTIWALKAESQDPFVSRTAVLNKLGGNSAAGFGLVFCRHGADESADETMLVAMIDTEQEYLVGEAVGPSFRVIVPWTYSGRLKYGYNQANEVGLGLDGDTRVFTLSLNGEAVREFSAIESDYDCGGSNGYIAVISPQDDFPDKPVRIAYQER